MLFLVGGGGGGGGEVDLLDHIYYESLDCSSGMKRCIFTI